MKNLIAILLASISTPLFSQIKIDTSYIGIYLKTLYDLSPSDNSFGADFYLWSNSTDTVSLFDQLEIVNAKKIDEYSSFNDNEINSFITYKNCKVQLTHNWDLRNYPFDNQRMMINIEAQAGVEFIYITDDKNGFEIDKNLSIPGWNITKSYVQKKFTTYPSDFGYRNTKFKDKRFHHISFVIELARKSWGLYFKLFTGLYIAFLVSFLAFFIRPDYVDPRFGLSVGGLFASVANKYVVDANIPATISFSFVDIVHFLSFIYILVTLIISSISLRLHSQGKIEKRKTLDRRASRIMILSYIIFNGILILLVV
ncbi:MAG: hypothetical protein E6H07_07740 [Bacteroidetes bacterium]|nr:MAG: hypothetical protein E6H07_07740 [Bacteroidota bacterium]